jgi:hypothetical protein
MGVIFIVVGIILVVAGIGLTSDYLTVSTDFHHVNSSYLSKEMNITSDGLVALQGNSTFYLVNANSTDVVNSANINHYSIAGIGNNSFGFPTEYLVGKGSYVLVSFERPQAGVVYSYTSHFSTFTDLGVILIIGLAVTAISFIVLIVGFLLKPRKGKTEKEIIEEESKE